MSHSWWLPDLNKFKYLEENWRTMYDGIFEKEILEVSDD